VVMAREDVPGSETLAAYIVPDREPTPTAAALRQALASQLPDYMVPSAFVTLDAMPMTPNGKVDRKALPAPTAAPGDREASFVAPEGILQLQLARIWEEILDVRPIGITDDFFELGGSSLLAARLVDRIADVCGRTLPLASLFAGATIRDVANALALRWNEGTHSPIVQVQEGNGKRPFFFLHGDLEDGGLYSVRLARALDPDRPLYVINPIGTNEEHVAHTIESVAADHLADLKATQPEGPYLLGGFCAGAYVAFEMAQRLRAEGQRVDALIMIEPATVFPHTRVVRSMINCWGNLSRVDPERRMQLFLLLRNGMKHRLRRLLARKRAEAAAAVTRLVRPGSVPAAPPTPPSADSAAARRAMKTEELLGRYSWATAGYKRRRYDGRLVVFWAADEFAKPPRDPSTGWKTFVDDIDVYPATGDHYGVITTHVEELAAQIRQWLDDAERAGRDQGTTVDGS
jgi:thioesterase domain-containing protein